LQCGCVPDCRVLPGFGIGTGAGNSLLHRVAAESWQLANMVAPLVKKPAGPKGKAKSQTFIIDCSKPVEDKIMDISSFEKFLLDKVKVDGKTGAFESVYCFAGCCAHARIQPDRMMGDGGEAAQQKRRQQQRRRQQWQQQERKRMPRHPPWAAVSVQDAGSGARLSAEAALLGDAPGFCSMGDSSPCRSQREEEQTAAQGRQHSAAFSKPAAYS